MRRFLLRCMSLKVALNRLAAMSDLSPLLGAERTQRRHLISAAIDPQRTDFDVRYESAKESETDVTQTSLEDRV
jgi:hypothetical protein